jgi:peptide/nickel transport system substrate-binding protein
LPTSWEPGTSVVAGYLRVPYETLTHVATDGSGEVSPMLATRWKETADSLTLTLRHGVRFHDGTPFDATAVKKNIEYVRDGKGQYAGGLSAIEDIKVLAPDRVELRLSNPTPSLPTTLGGLGVPMTSPKALEAGTLKRAPVGTGPWAYDEKGSIAGTKLRFAFFPGYWDAKDVNVGAIELHGVEDSAAGINAIKTGEIDVGRLDLSFAEQAKASKLGVALDPALFNTMLFFDRGPGGMFADVNARKAVCSAIDTEAITKLYAPNQFVLADQRFGEGKYGHNPSIEGYPHDPDAAKRYLAEAGNPKLAPSLVAFEDNQRQGQGYAAQLAQVGITLGIQKVPFPQYLTTWNSGKYPIGSGATLELTPYDWYASWFAETAPGNPSRVESPQLKRAAEAAIAAGSAPESDELWGKVMKVIDDEALACAHTIVNGAIAYRPERVENVHGIEMEPSSLDYRAIRLKGE